jgi:hypothetical protein
MPKFLSERKRNLSVGISSYTDDSTVLEVTGRIGIGTSYATAGMHIEGDAYVSGILTASILNPKKYLETKDVFASGIVSASSFRGDGSTLDNIVGNTVQSAIGEEPVYIGFLSTTTGIFTSFSTNDGIVYIPSTKNLGIKTSLPDYDLTVDGDTKVTGIVTAAEFYGDQIIGTPSGGFLPGAVGIDTSDYTKDSVNEINFILGKLVPKPPTSIFDAEFTLTGLTGVGRLCSSFSPINNTNGEFSPSAGNQYDRNVDNTVTSNYITEYGPGDAGTVIGFVNAVGVGTTTLSTGSNDGLYGSLRIINDKDAFFSSRNTGIASLFYEVYDARLENAPSPDGFNKAFIEQNSSKTQRAFWYEDPSTVGAPILTSSTPTTPPSPTLNYSSGVPHYTQASNNGFEYVITCENATGDMYTTNTFLTSSTPSAAGFQNGGSKSYTDFAGGTIPPARNFGVGVGVTCLITQIPRDLHLTVSTDATRFSTYTATTPYGTDTVRATITQAVNIMGTTARTDKIDEDNILISSLGTGSGNSIRVNAGASGDNPTPVYTSWNASSSVSSYESVVRGAVLRHDQTNYSTGYLPVGPNYSSGRSGSQYFQIQIIRSQVSEFNIIVTGSYAGCWVCMPDNSNWTTGLSNTNGWADMFLAAPSSGVPRNGNNGCSSGGVMTGSSGTFKCVFGTESSSNDTNNRILVRWKLNSGQSITAMSFAST